MSKVLMKGNEALALAAIRGATTAIFIEGPAIDELLFAGPGAGGDPTATAVLGDVIDGKGEVKTYPLGGAGFYDTLRWSPDSKKILFSDKQFILYGLDVDGLVATVLRS